MIGNTFIVFESIGSTNDYAKEHLRSLTHGTVVRALTQTSGRGQRGNVWHSPPGENLYFSVVLKPDCVMLGTTLILQLIRFSAQAIVALMRDFYGIEAMIKPPNDIYVRGRKISGILVEALTVGQKIQGYVVGIGVNCNTRLFNPELRDSATSLEIEYGKKVDVELFFKQLLQRCELYYQMMWK